MSPNAGDPAYEPLTETYGSMGSMDWRIAAEAESFNDTYIDENRGNREYAAAQTRDVAAQARALRDKIYGMNVLTSSALYNNWQVQMRLADDLVNRVNALVEAWDLSLSFDDPAAHRDEILGPIARDNDEGGANVYRLDFERNYAAARP